MKFCILLKKRVVTQDQLGTWRLFVMCYRNVDSQTLVIQGISSHGIGVEFESDLIVELLMKLGRRNFRKLLFRIWIMPVGSQAYFVIAGI